jgi:hypothetical protein
MVVLEQQENYQDYKMATKYFFYNIYSNEEDDLLNSLPNDVIAIKAGWDLETEKLRNDKLEELNLNGVGGYPAIVYWKDSYIKTYTDINNEEQTITIPAQWTAYNLFAEPKENWNWNFVLNNIDE